MKKLSVYLLIIGLITITQCATEPEFERDNPYDVPLIPSDSVDANLNVLSGANYSFTEYGLKLKLNRNIEGNVRILRKNGPGDLTQIYQESNHPAARDYYDGDIRTVEDVGYPLTYKIFYQPAGVSTESSLVIDVFFGAVTLESHFEESGSYIVDFDYSDLLLNDGIHLLQYSDNDTTLISAVEKNVSRLYVPVDELSPALETAIVPFKMYRGVPTYLDDKSFFLKPAAPSFIMGTVIDTSSISISWTDNSSLNSKQRIIIDGVPKDLPSDTEEYILKDTFRAFDTYSIEIESFIGNTSKSKTSESYSIPDFPYPRIDRIEHLDEFSFRIYFTDRVEFGRDLTFVLQEELIKVSNSNGFVEFNTNPEFIGYSISFSARLSFGQYGSRNIEVRHRPTIDLIETKETNSALNEDLLDVRTIGNLLLYADGAALIKLDISDIDNQAQNLFTHADEIDILSLSNNNQRAAFSSNNELHLFDITTQTAAPLTLDGSPDIFDFTFINEDADLLLSTSAGLFIYSLDDNNVSNVSNFDTTNPLVFFGDALETRIVALDRSEHQLYYFNTMNGFNLHLSAETTGGAFVADSSYVNNVDHYTVRSNAIGFGSGEAYQFSIFPHCQTSNKCNEIDFETDHYDNNAFSIVIGPKHRFVVSDNYYRLIGQENGNDFHVIKKPNLTNPTLLKINRDNELIIEFDAIQQELRFYDIDWEWRFTNYGILNRIVWPAN